MNAKNLAFIFCAIIICGCVRRSRCKNVTITTSEASPISIERITELYLTIVDLIEQFDRGVIPHYSKFFDAGLMRKARDVFRQLYGYARNETQGIKWEASAVKYFQQYVIHASATQANVHYEYYAEFIDKKIGEPCSLRMICLARLRQQIESYLRSNSTKLYVYGEMPAYILRSFTILPVFVVSTNAKPFLLIKLNQYYYHRRFVDEVAFAGAVAQKNRTQKLYMNPMPYSPVENFANEMKIFRRAQASVYNLLNYCPSASQIKEFADAGVIALLNQIVNYHFSKRTADERFNSDGCCLRRQTLIIIFHAFLQNEYNRLICHPFFRLSDDRGTPDLIKTRIHYRQVHINEFYKTFFDEECSQGVSCASCNFTKNIQNLLWRAGAIVGYSLRHLTGIAALLNVEEISSA